MNEFNDSSWKDDQRFDRLVDGELSPDEYNDLLRSLDQRPDGWRRCALAFLEAQTLRQELGQPVGESQVSSRAATPSAGGKKHVRRWPGLLAVAASFLVAFGLGLMFRAGWSGTRSDTEGSPIAKDDTRPEAPAQSPARDAEIAEMPMPESPLPGRHRGSVRLVVDRPDGSGSQEFEAPLYDWSPEYERMLTEDRFRIPPGVRRVLQRMGREVRWDQQVLPFETEDGQRVLVPFGQLEITPVGGQHYQ